MPNFNKIVVVGDGWGAIAVLKGLSNFKLPVYAISNDPDVLSIASNQMRENLDSFSGELLLFAGYKPIVPASVLRKNTCLNIHYSLLPNYRGLHSTVWAILNDEDYLGATIHVMNENIDDGPIVYQYKVANDRIKTSTEYMELFNARITECIGQVLNDYIDENIHPRPQDKSLASWVGKRNEQDCMIDFAKPLAYQKAFFRALVSPYPLPFVTHKGNKYVVTKAGYHPSNVVTHIGRILNIDDEGLWVKCEDGYLVLHELRDEDNRIVPVSVFRIGQYLNKQTGTNFFAV